MSEYTLTRLSTSDAGTLGQITNEFGFIICKTMELPWLDNEPDKSCIPVGTYQCVPHNTQSHPDTWELLNVPNRSGVLIHGGNTEVDSLGCILVGNMFGEINGLPAVINSQKTMQMLRSKLPDSFKLTIVEKY